MDGWGVLESECGVWIPVYNFLFYLSFLFRFVPRGRVDGRAGVALAGPFFGGWVNGDAARACLLVAYGEGGEEEEEGEYLLRSPGLRTFVVHGSSAEYMLFSIQSLRIG